MAAASASSANADLLVVSDLYLIALCQGRNEADTTGLLAIPDEELAAELQLQEVIVSSAMAAATAAQSSLTPQPADSAVHADNNDAAAAEAPALAVAKCCCSSSSSPPPLAVNAAAEDGTETSAICKICLDNVSPSVMHRGSSGCTHAFCAACLTRYISGKIQDRISDVKCPGDGEDCGSVLDPELCQSILSREAFEAWDAALCMSMVLCSSNVRCPFNDCSVILVDERGGEIPQSECPLCRRPFCAQCGVPWHAGISCAEYVQLAPGDRGEEDLVVLEMAKGNKWMRCPRCKFLVDRQDGCVHMTCRCAFQFCYGCGQPWEPSDHSSCRTA